MKGSSSEYGTGTLGRRGAYLGKLRMAVRVAGVARPVAGLVHEERRGKWGFYSLDRTAAGQLLAETAAHLDGRPGNDG
jgi:hypothetical protein